MITLYGLGFRQAVWRTCVLRYFAAQSSWLDASGAFLPHDFLCVAQSFRWHSTEQYSAGATEPFFVQPEHCLKVMSWSFSEWWHPSHFRIPCDFRILDMVQGRRRSSEPWADASRDPGLGNLTLMVKFGPYPFDQRFGRVWRGSYSFALGGFW